MPCRTAASSPARWASWPASPATRSASGRAGATSARRSPTATRTSTRVEDVTEAAMVHALLERGVSHAAGAAGDRPARRVREVAAVGGAAGGHATAAAADRAARGRRRLRALAARVAADGRAAAAARTFVCGSGDLEDGRVASGGDAPPSAHRRLLRRARRRVRLRVAVHVPAVAARRPARRSRASWAWAPGARATRVDLVGLFDPAPFAVLSPRSWSVGAARCGARAAGRSRPARRCSARASRPRSSSRCWPSSATTRPGTSWARVACPSGHTTGGDELRAGAGASSARRGCARSPPRPAAC